MPAGITSEASIRYKDEDKLLNGAEEVDEVYVKQVLPVKRSQKWNSKLCKKKCWKCFLMQFCYISYVF